MEGLNFVKYVVKCIAIFVLHFLTEDKKYIALENVDQLSSMVQEPVKPSQQEMKGILIHANISMGTCDISYIADQKYCYPWSFHLNN